MKQVLDLSIKNKIKVLLVAVILVLSLILISNRNYKIVMERVDAYSPDVILKVYKNKKEIRVELEKE